MVDASIFLKETQRQFTRMYQVAYSILRTRQDAEDAVQQALLKGWSARSSARAETFVQWLMRILVNECRNIQRHRMRVMPCEAIAEGAEAFAPPDLDLATAVQALPDTLRIPFSLKYLAQLTEREVAQALHIPVYTVKNRLKKARKTLREALREWEVTFE